MTAVVVNVVELNRRRHVELESITLALGEAIAAGEHAGGIPAGLEADALEPVRELRRALATLVTQPLPEALMADAGTGELAVELEAPAHELEAVAEELDRVRDLLEGAPAADSANMLATDELESLAGRLRHRALTRS